MRIRAGKGFDVLLRNKTDVPPFRRYARFGLHPVWQALFSSSQPHYRAFFSNSETNIVPAKSPRQLLVVVPMSNNR